MAVATGVTDVVADGRAEVAVEALARGDHRAAATAADAAEGLDRTSCGCTSSPAGPRSRTTRGCSPASPTCGRLRVSPEDPIALLARVTDLVARAESTHTRAHIVAAYDELRRLLAHDPYDADLWRLAARIAVLNGDAELAREAAGGPPSSRRPGSAGERGNRSGRSGVERACTRRHPTWPPALRPAIGTP